MVSYLATFLVALAFILRALPAWANDPSERLLEEAVTALDRKDFKRGLQLIRPLAEKGHPFAQWLLGDLYRAGEGVSQDINIARRWWMQAASKGSDAAETSLGDSYAPEDWKQANMWWRKAADRGNARAQTALGLAFYDGKGLAQDRREAASWFKKGAEGGNVHAQAILAHMYFRGEGELKASLTEAYKWILIAGDEGKELTAKTRIMLEPFLRPTEKQEAVRLAELWKFEKGRTKTPPPAPLRDEDVPLTYFVSSSALLSRCSSAVASDLAWCDAYVAGVIDTLGGRRHLDEDARDARLCLRDKKLSTRQAREAVKQALGLVQEDKNSPLANSPGSGSVVAGLLTYICKP